MSEFKLSEMVDYDGAEEANYYYLDRLDKIRAADFEIVDMIIISITLSLTGEKRNFVNYTSLLLRTKNYAQSRSNSPTRNFKCD